MVRLAGYLFSNAGVARDLAASTVGAFTANTADDTTAIGSAIASTETDANGLWQFTALAEANYDVRIVDGSSIRWVKYSTEIQCLRITPTTIELGHGTDTTLSRVSAGLMAVEGITVVDVSTAQTLTNKTFNLTSNTFVATSAQLATAVTDETGSGALVFGTSPTMTSPVVNTQLTGTAVGTGASQVAQGSHTTPAMTATVAGHVPTPPNIATQYLDGTGLFSTPAGSGIPAATQAEMEAATSNTVAATPGRTQYHPGVAKFWVKYTYSGVATVSYNVTSITDTGLGDATVNIGTDFSSADWVPLVGVQVLNNGDFYRTPTTPGAGTLQIVNADYDNAGAYQTGVAVDGTAGFAAGFGDQ